MSVSYEVKPSDEITGAPEVDYYTPEQPAHAGTFYREAPDQVIPKIFQPLKIGKITLQNRIGVSPMCQYSADENLEATPYHLIHFGAMVTRGPGINNNTTSTTTATTTTATTTTTTSTSTPTSKHLKNGNKRRRVIRACDTCRQKKVKCDGKQPCIHCKVYSYKCTYDQPNIRRKKNSGIPVPSQPSPAILPMAAQAAVAFGTNSNHNSPDNGQNIQHPDGQFQQHSPLNETLPKTNQIIFQQIINALFPKLQLNGFDPNLQLDLNKFQKAVQYTTTKSPTFALNLNNFICWFI
ncbi:Activator of stress genes protein 1 [Candida tropicalis]